MICPRCNTQFEGTTCPICFAVVNPQDPQVPQPPMHSQNRPCPRCGNPMSGAQCFTCGFLDAPQSPPTEQIPLLSHQKTQSLKKNLIIAACTIGALALIGVVLISRMAPTIQGFLEKEFSQIMPFENRLNDKFDLPASGTTYPNGICTKEFNKLKKGMTYAQVSGIIGGDGMLADKGTDPVDGEYYTYGWTAENGSPDSYVMIRFIDSVVDTITVQGELG